MRLQAWIVDAPGGGCCMQILEQTGVRPKLLTDGVRAEGNPAIEGSLVFLRGNSTRDFNFHVDCERSRTAQSVVDQITAGLAGHAEVREPKRGDRVQVDTGEGESKRTRIFLHEVRGAKNPILCVTENTERAFVAAEEEFHYLGWVRMHPIPQPVRYSREGDVHTWPTE